MKIREALPDDADQIGQLIFDTVRSINSNDYSQEQVEAWAPDSQIFRTYPESFAYVVEIEVKIVGFANITDEGYLNRFYTHKDHQGQGVGTLLLAQIEEKAKLLKLPVIRTEASITAKPFFLSKGWIVIEQQTVYLRGLSFINFKMEKVIQ